MGEFKSSVAKIGSTGVEAIEPQPFSGKLSETQLEDAICQDPSLLGEELLVLGRQLADFAEDAKRLDVLALDKEGEVVLVEMKVDEDYAFTDLQAIGYAGAYSQQDDEFFAGILARSASNAVIRNAAGLPEDPSKEQALEAIRSFLELPVDTDWTRSRQTRIKLLAPDFPKRVLHNVKWLGEVYGMPIEAIQVRLFDIDGVNHLHFDRLLPLPGAEQFDLSVRDREVSIRKENARRKPVLKSLVQAGILKSGDRVWLLEVGLPANLRSKHDDTNQMFSGVVDEDNPSKLLWSPSHEVEPKPIAPASVPANIASVLEDKPVSEYNGIPVAENYLDEATGKTLRELAFEHKIW